VFTWGTYAAKFAWRGFYLGIQICAVIYRWEAFTGLKTVKVGEAVRA
jgi:hypothetical protein